jgi:hypothetical protein
MSVLALNGEWPAALVLGALWDLRDEHQRSAFVHARPAPRALQ